jgi:diguanylate cyclase (GGDEF)-like protein
MIDLRGWVAGILGAVVIAAAVLIASEQQRATGETNFKEAQAADQMEVAMLGQERALDGFLASGQPSLLATLYHDQVQLTDGIEEARRFSADDSVESRAVRAQDQSFRAWAALATPAITRRERGAEDSVPSERRRSRVIDSFLLANGEYRSRLLVNRYREEQTAALLPVWLLLGLGAAFGAAALFVTRRKRLARLRREAFADSQARFVEAIQFADDEREADELLGTHIESAIAGSEVIVLKRNPEFDRLDAAQQLPKDHPLSASLSSSDPRTCLAVRLSRRYDHDEDTAPEKLRCTICGTLDTPASCQPLLVGGEVIGSVLVAHGRRLEDDAELCLRDTVARAAPVLANLRNLALAETRATTDALTGLPNRRSVDATLDRMLAQAARTSSPMSIGLLDLDHFKQINDNYGHDRGDDVLSALAAQLRDELRASDFPGRHGGEEFVFFLPDTNRAGAITVAEKIRNSVSKLRIAGVDRPITASIGVATFPDDAATADGLRRAADEALYAAKAAGRNRTQARAVSGPSAGISTAPAIALVGGDADPG